MAPSDSNGKEEAPKQVKDPLRYSDHFGTVYGSVYDPDKENMVRVSFDTSGQCFSKTNNPSYRIKVKARMCLVRG